MFRILTTTNVSPWADLATMPADPLMTLNHTAMTNRDRATQTAARARYVLEDEESHAPATAAQRFWNETWLQASMAAQYRLERLEHAIATGRLELTDEEFCNLEDHR